MKVAVLPFVTTAPPTAALVDVSTTTKLLVSSELPSTASENDAVIEALAATPVAPFVGVTDELARDINSAILLYFKKVQA